MVLPGLKTLKSLLSNSSHRRGNGTKKLKEKGDNRDGANDVPEGCGSDAQKDKSPIISNKSGHQVHPEVQANEKYNSMISLQGKVGGSPPLMTHGPSGHLTHLRAPSLMTDNKSEGWSALSGETKEAALLSREYKKGNSLPAGVAPPPYNSEELLLDGNGGVGLVNRKDTSYRMTTSATSPLLSANSKSRTNWDSPLQLKRKTIADVQDIRDIAAVSEESDSEKRDPAKECLEKRVLKMENQLNEERGYVQHEYVTTATPPTDHDRYQSRFNTTANGGVDQQEFERERLLRHAAEERLKEVTFEKDSFKEQVACLQEEMRKKESGFYSGNHSQRNLNHGNKCHLESKYERKLQNCQLNVVRLGKVNSLLVKEIRNLEGVMSSLDQSGTVGGENRTNKVLLERIKYLEAENSSLVMESEQQRMLYERCLDDVANQVVQALLVQKSLQETCSKLKKRVDDLEQQNRTLHILFQQQLHRAWDPRANQRSAPSVLPEMKMGNVSPILPMSLSSQYLQVGKKMIRSSSSSTSCSQSSSSSSGGSRSPVTQSSSSDGSISSDFSPVSSSGKVVQSVRTSEFLDENRRLSLNQPRGGDQGNRVLWGSAAHPQDQMHDTNGGVTSENINVCWKDSCSVCKDEECFRDDCCSACSCSTPSVTPLHHREQNCLNYFLPYVKERRPPPHGPVMGMTDLLRLNNRKSVEANVGHPDINQRWTNKMVKFGGKQIDGDVEMRLDNMTTPSDDGQICLYKNLDINTLSDHNAYIISPRMTAGNIKPNPKYKLSEDSSNEIVTTSWRGSYNPSCYSAALNTYQNTAPAISSCQRPQHLKLCKHYTLPSNLSANKKIPFGNYCFNFDKGSNSVTSEFSATKLISENCSSKPNSESVDVTSRLVDVICSQSMNNDGNESGLESVEASPKDSLLCSSVSEDQEDTTSKKSGAKDEGYSTMSSDIQCEGEADDQSRRASINVSPDFLIYDSSNDPKVGSISAKSKGDGDSAKIASSQGEQEALVQISSQSESLVASTLTDKSSSIVNKLTLCDLRGDSESGPGARKYGVLSSLKETSERGTAFGSLSLLTVKAGHVESMKEKFELECKKDSDLWKNRDSESEKSSCRSSCKCGTNGRATVLHDASTEKLLHQKPHIIVGDDVDVFYLPIYCPLTSDDSSTKKPIEILNGTFKRSKSDSCLYPGRGACQLHYSNNSYDSQHRKWNPANDIAYHRSAWDLTDHASNDLMALYRSKACFSLAEDASQLGYLSASPLETALLGWHSSFSPASLNSIHSLCSGSGEASLLHEAPASRSKLSPVSIESSCLFSSNDEDEINTSDEAWFLPDSFVSEKEFLTPLSETAVNYNDEEICNWSLNYSSEEICPRRTPDDADWEQLIGQRRIAMSSTSTHNGLFPRPTDSLPSIQEVDDDDGESFLSLPSNRNLINNANKCADRRGRGELKNRTRRKEGTCNSWPSTNDRSSKVWCRANLFMDRLNGHHPSLPLHSSDSIKSWGSSMRCVSDDLSDGHSKDLSVSSFGIGSGFASTPDSKSSVDQSVGALEESDTTPLETHFTRDFYRLCKVESCRSLDVSCKSLTATNSSSREVPKENLNVNDIDVMKHGNGIQILEKSDALYMTGEKFHISENSPIESVAPSVEIEITTEIAVDLLAKDFVQDRNEPKRANDEDDSYDKEQDELTESDLGNQSSTDLSMKKEGCTTSWVHFEADVDLSDPKARANLLDSMLASSTSSSDTEIDSDTADDDYKYQHLHDIHRVRRFRRAFDREQCVVRYVPPTRPSILDRKDFFYRFGEKEKEAVASFDFLESMSTSISDVGSVETLDGCSPKKDGDGKSYHFGRISLQSGVMKQDTNRNSLPAIFNGNSHSDRLCKNRVVDIKANIYENGSPKLSTLALSQDGDTTDRLSFSDSCAESFSCSYTSLNMEL